MTITTVDDDVLLCPVCGGRNTHIDRVEMTTAEGKEDGPLKMVALSAGRLFTDEEPGTSEALPGWLRTRPVRRHAFTLIGTCEGGDHEFAITFWQNKGETQVLLTKKVWTE